MDSLCSFGELSILLLLLVNPNPNPYVPERSCICWNVQSHHCLKKLCKSPIICMELNSSQLQEIYSYQVAESEKKRM